MGQHEIEIYKVCNFIIFRVSHRLCPVLRFGFSGEADNKVGIVLFCTCALYPLHEQCGAAWIFGDTGHSAVCCKNIYGADAFSHKLCCPEKSYFPAQVLISFKENIIFFSYKNITGDSVSPFSFVTGVKVQDTQTGLRAFSNQDVAFMQQIEGERYEYEINVLLEYAKRNRRICEVPITTIYLDDNKSSHFHAVRDCPGSDPEENRTHGK